MIRAWCGVAVAGALAFTMCFVWLVPLAAALDQFVRGSVLIGWAWLAGGAVWFFVWPGILQRSVEAAQAARPRKPRP